MIRMLPYGTMPPAVRWDSFMVQGLGRLLTALVSSPLKGSANSLRPSPGWASQPTQGRCCLLASSAARRTPSNTALRTHPLVTFSSPPPKQELPWFIDGVRFMCTGCGKCCRTRGDVWLSPDEVRLAAEHERLDLEGFTTTYLAETDRGWARLKSKPSPHEGGGDACVFLNNNNTCSIYEARPLQCRTYPYWPSIVRSRDTWDREAVVPDDRKEGRHWNAEDGGCEGVNHENAELVPFGVIWSNMQKQVAYIVEKYRVSEV